MTVFRVTEGFMRKTELGMMLLDHSGVPWEKEKVYEIIREILKTVNKDEYDDYREQREIQAYEWATNASSPKVEKKANPAMVYLMRCENKYKIGVTKDLKED